jgi:hypothetical protein
MNRPDAKKYKCGKCDGIGFVKQGVAEGSEQYDEISDKAFDEGYAGYSYRNLYPEGTREYEEYHEGWYDGRLAFEKANDYESDFYISRPEKGVAEGLRKRDQKDVAAIKATIERLQAQLKQPNADKAAIQQSIAHEQKRLALYGQGVAEGLDSDQRARLDDLIDTYRDATDPSDDGYGVNDHYDPDEVLDQIRREFGDNIASKVEAGTDKMHFPRQGHSQAYDRLSRKDPVSRITKTGKMYKQDSDFRKNNIAAKFRVNGKKGPLPLPEGDAYFESLNSMLERQLEPTMDLDVWVDNFQNADPNKYHQFKNKSPEKKK